MDTLTQRDTASLVISGWQSDWLGDRMAAQAREMLPARHPVQLNPGNPVYLLEYVHGVLITSGGPYWNADVAKQASDVGKWIELPDGAGWRSEDGRTLIQADA
jgi:hypothetical protein